MTLALALARSTYFYLLLATWLLLSFFRTPQGKLIHRKVKAKAERARDFARTY
jgi:hypothetical protein